MGQQKVFQKSSKFELFRCSFGQYLIKSEDVMSELNRTIKEMKKPYGSHCLGQKRPHVRENRPLFWPKKWLVTGIWAFVCRHSCEGFVHSLGTRNGSRHVDRLYGAATWTVLARYTVCSQRTHVSAPYLNINLCLK